MHSSISNSEVALSRTFEFAGRKRARRSIWAILLGLLLTALAAELFTVLAIHYVSKIGRRTLQEYGDAQRLATRSASGRPTMLLLGNSLLLAGVDYPTLRNQLSPQYDVHRLVFEQTEYLDQFYVLRTLLRNGMRPHYVVLCTSVNHLIGNENRGEFMSRFMEARDVASLGRRQHLDATTLSGLMFAHWSQWYAFRAETRKAVLGAVMPKVPEMAMILGLRPAPPVSADEIRYKAEPRLRELKSLCDQYGVRLAILVPPARRQDHADIVVSLGEHIGIPVLVPEPGGAMGADLFGDGFHLNRAGAEIFTAKTQSELMTLEH